MISDIFNNGTSLRAICYYSSKGYYSNGLSPNGLLNDGSSAPFLGILLPPGPLPPLGLGGGFGGISVIITREMVLSMSNFEISGFIYRFLMLILPFTGCIQKDQGLMLFTKVTY
jgi:hypothetical protein